MRLRSIAVRWLGLLGRPCGPSLIGILGALAGVLLVTSLPGAQPPSMDIRAPGLRFKKDPGVVIPAPYAYTNRTLSLPQYRNSAGQAARGWSRKYVATRRFNSNQSAWIYFRPQDLNRCTILDVDQHPGRRCIWPGGSCLVVESYGADLPEGPDRPPLDIAVMVKAEKNSGPFGDVFFAAEWSYARFNAQGQRVTDSAGVADCHQCHGIAFQLTGDSIFTRFP